MDAEISYDENLENDFKIEIISNAKQSSVQTEEVSKVTETKI